MKTKLIAALSVALSLGVAAPAFAAGGGGTLLDHDWSFEGPFGTFDQAELQRGFQVYKEVCAGCHGMKYLYFRNLSDKNGPGIPEDEVKVIASEFTVPDPDGEPGDTRDGKPFDRFPASAVENAPDLSLMAKARAGGAAHSYSVLLGYNGEEKEEAGTFFYGNTAFPGGWIAMAPPLSEDLVEYQDGTPATMQQMAHDVSAFLMWAAEPKMMERKSAGIRNILFLIVFATMLWFVNKKVWKPVKKHDG